MLLLDLLEGRLEVIIDAVELGRLGEVDHELGLQDDAALVFIILRLLLVVIRAEHRLMGLGLEAREGHVLVLEQAPGDEADSQEGLVVDAVELDRVEPVLEQGLGLDDQGLETGRLSHNDHIVLLDELGLLVIDSFLGASGSVDVDSFFLVFLNERAHP